jgi:putative addiction module component (TIGR02574 family)
MDVQSIKIDLIHWLTEPEDQAILIKVQELKEEQEEDYELTKEQRQELETRLGKYEAGETHFSSWDTVQQRVRSRAKDGL